MHRPISMQSVETKASWTIATVVLVILTLSFGAPWITIVALKPIAAETDGLRSVPALATSLAWIGFGAGGIAMGYVAEKIGVRWTVIFGAVMIWMGLALSTGGETWHLYVGQGLFVGFFGIGGMNAPFYVYVSRWFDRRRGSALALISSGSYLAGAIWPSMFERAITYAGWRQTMFYYGLLEVVLVVPLAAIFLRQPPELALPEGAFGTSPAPKTVMGWPPNLVFGLVAAAVDLLLHSHGDAAGPSARAVQRSRHPGVARRGHAVGALGHRLHQPSVLGLGFRPRRRAQHRVDRLVIPDHRDDRVHADAG